MKTSAVIPKDYEAHLRVFNSMPCNFNLQINGSEAMLLSSLQVYENKDLTVSSKNPSDLETLRYTLTARSGNCAGQSGNFQIGSKTTSSYHVFGQDIGNYRVIPFDHTPDKSNNGSNLVNVVANFGTVRSVQLRDIKDSTRIFVDRASNDNEKRSVPKGDYDVYVGTTKVGNTLSFKTGGVYTLNFLESGSTFVSL